MIITNILDIFKHIHFITLLKNNVLPYFFSFIFSILLIYLMAILIIIELFTIKKQKLYFFWPITLLKILLPIISITFYGQIFLLLITVFDCIDGFAFVNANIKCRTGLWFKILSPMIIIAIIFHTIMAIITSLLYFKPIFSDRNSYILKKVNTVPDIIFLFTKIGFNILFSLDKNNEEDHWVILFFLILFSGINAYFSICYQNRANNVLIILNKSLSLMLFLAVLSILMGKLLKYAGFNGLIFWFILSNILIVLFIIFYKKDNTNFSLIDLKKIENSSEYLKCILIIILFFLIKIIQDIIIQLFKVFFITWKEIA